MPELKITKMPKYMSPSSLITYTNTPFIYFLRYLDKNRFLPRWPSNMANGTGTAFDVLVKEKLINEKNVKSSKTVGELYNGIASNIKKPALLLGEQILSEYTRSGIFYKHKWGEVEKHVTVDVYGVPVHGQLDATVWDKEYKMFVPHDFKVSGAAKVGTDKAGVSPAQGYYRIWDSKKNCWGSMHKKFVDGIPIEQIKDDWAIQFCIYGWINNPDLVDNIQDFPVYCDHVVFNGKDKNIKIAQYRAICTVDFQKNLMQRLQQAWSSIHDNVFINNLLGFEFPKRITQQGMNDYLLIKALKEDIYN